MKKALFAALILGLVMCHQTTALAVSYTCSGADMTQVVDGAFSEVDTWAQRESLNLDRRSVDFLHEGVDKIRDTYYQTKNFCALCFHEDVKTSEYCETLIADPGQGLFPDSLRKLHTLVLMHAELSSRSRMISELQSFYDKLDHLFGVLTKSVALLKKVQGNIGNNVCTD